MKPGFRFCKRCGHRREADAEHEPEDVTLVAPHPAPPPDVPDPANFSSTTFEPPLTPSVPPPRKKKFLGLIIAVIAGGALIIGAVVIGMSRNTSEKKLQRAIASGNLLSPSGESAYDYYRKLQSEGADPAVLKTHEEKLLPLLKQKPQELIAQVVSTSGRNVTAIEWDEAEKMMQWANEINPRDKSLAAWAAYSAGRAAYAREDRKVALESWLRARELDDSWELPNNGIGVIYNERKQYSTARQYLEQAIRQAPQWPLPYNNMGTSYYLEGNYYSAAKYYEQARDLAPEWARPHAWLGSIANQQKDYCGAAREYQLAHDLETPDMSNWNSASIIRQLELAKRRCELSTGETSDARRILFGPGGTQATVTGTTEDTDSYVLGAKATQVMTVSLSSTRNNARLHVLDTQRNTLTNPNDATWWSGTLSTTGDYIIMVEATESVTNYTLQVNIPPPTG